MGSNLRIRRLFQEDDGVEGIGFFHKRPEKTLHVLGNVLRLICAIVFSPFYLLTPRFIVNAVDNYVQAGWLLEYATTPDSVLSNARSGGKAQYDVTGFRPTWVLKAAIETGKLQSYEQIPFSEEVEIVGYTALS
ncbi:hypothetical protein FB451DRAFT_1026247, partial [Mycena latifolia]